MKRIRLIYVVIFLWILIGGLGIYQNVDLTDLSVYFSSLTACVASYIWGETKRKSLKPNKKIPTSVRERLAYFSIILWLLLGIWGIIDQGNLKSYAAYFGSISGFIVSFIIGHTYKGDGPQEQLKKLEDK